jgi:uncharacterized membrane protein (DUF106 family)
MLFGNPILEITVVCLGLAIFSQVISRKFRKKSGAAEKQALIKEKQKKMKELIKKNPNDKEIDKIQKETMEIMQGMMSETYKQMFFTLPVFLVVYWGLGFFFGGELLLSPIAYPKLTAPDFGVFTFEMGYQRFYFFTYMIFSILIAIVLKFVDNKIKNKGIEKEVKEEDKKVSKNKKEKKENKK